MDGRLKKMARAGFVAKGAVYGITGVLILLAVLNMGGDTPGKTEVLDFLEKQPFGNFLLIAMGAGLAFYAAWRFIQSFSDPEDIGTDAKAKLKRTGLFISGLLYLSLAGAAVLKVIDPGGSGSNGGGGSDAAKDVPFLASDVGLVLLGAAGFIVAAVGIFRFVRAFKGDFKNKFDVKSMSEEKRRKSIKTTAIFGMSARGAILLIVAFFLLKAAFTADRDEIKSSSEVFSFIQESPYGPWLLALVAIGLIAYAIHMFLLAKYRKFRD